MRPLGLAWGNDPTLDTMAFDAGVRTTESIILNPSTGSVAKGGVAQQHLGGLDRLNGPIDNPASSCVSCHGTARWPSAAMVPPSGSRVTDATKLKWFQNIRPGQVFDPSKPNAVSLDYSLQVMMGIRNFEESRRIRLVR